MFHIYIYLDGILMYFGGEFVQFHHSQRFEASPSKIFFSKESSIFGRSEAWFWHEDLTGDMMKIFFPLKVRHSNLLEILDCCDIKTKCGYILVDPSLSS